MLSRSAGSSVVAAVEGEEPGADGLEFQFVEELLQGGLVRPRFGQVVQRDRKFQVRVEPVQPAVALDVLDILAQGIAHLAADGIQVLQDALEPAVEVDPLGGGLGADAGHAGEVVRGLAHQRGEVRVLRRA